MSLHRPRHSWFVAMAGALVLLCCAGCWKKSGEAVVLEKVYLPAVAVSPSPDASPDATGSEPSATPGEEVAVVQEETERADPEGSPSDPRATSFEQWIVTVRMIDNARRIDVRVDQPQWEKLKEGDRVHVYYREGKYTGTVWSAEIR